MGLFRKYYELLARVPGDGRRLLILTALMTVAAGLEAVGVGLVMPFIALIQRPELADESRALKSVTSLFAIRTTNGAVIFVGIALLVVFIFKNIYLASTLSLQMRFIYNRMTLFARDLFSAYLSRQYSFFLLRNSTELVRNVVSDATAIFFYAMPAWFVLFVELVTCGVLGALLVALEPVAVPLVALVIGGGGYAFQRFHRMRVNTLAESVRKNETALVKYANQAFGGIKEFRVLGSEPFIIQIFEDASREHSRSMRLQRSNYQLPRYMFETLAVSGMVLVATVVLLRGGKTERLVALLGVMALAVVRVMPSAVRILGALHDVRHHAPAIAALHADLVAAEPRYSRAVPLPFEREIRIEDVGFKYESAAEASLDAVSLTIKKGESVAFIGGSGAGKTTLVDLMIGLLRPTRGTISVDGMALNIENTPRWQRNIGYIPQQVYLSDDSIRRNVAFGVPDSEIDEARLGRALAMAQLEELVSSLPAGLDTFVGERGVRISGGQRQRIGIARAIYLDPKVLILDEATSALDGLTESQVVEALDTAREGRTIVVIAHRLSTVRNCDRLFYMSQGKIADVGTWDELLSRSAEFRQLVELSSRA